MAGWYGWKWLMVAALMAIAGAGAPVGAQSSTGALAGRLTDLYSRPIGGATVVLRNRETGAALQAKTNRDGAYRFGSVPAGEYSLDAESAGRGHGHVDGIVVAAGHVAHVQAAVQLEPETAATASEPAQPSASAHVETARADESKLVAARAALREAAKRPEKIPEVRQARVELALRPEALRELRMSGVAANPAANTAGQATARVSAGDGSTQQAQISATAAGVAQSEQTLGTAAHAAQPAVGAPKAARGAAATDTGDAALAAEQGRTLSAEQLQALPLAGR